MRRAGEGRVGDGTKTPRRRLLGAFQRQLHSHIIREYDRSHRVIDPPLEIPPSKVVATPLERLIPFRKLQGAASLLIRRSQARPKAASGPSKARYRGPFSQTHQINALTYKIPAVGKRWNKIQSCIHIAMQCI